VIYYPTVMARYSLFVLKVPLNPNQTNKRSENNIKCVVVHDDLGRKNRTTRYINLQVFCCVTGFMSDFLSLKVAEHIRFFHGALHLYL